MKLYELLSKTKSDISVYDALTNEFIRRYKAGDDKWDTTAFYPVAWVWCDEDSIGVSIVRR